MASSYTTRKLEVFSLHARSKGETVDYQRMFGAIVAMPARRRQVELVDKIVILRKMARHTPTGRVNFTAYEGPTGVNPLIVDAALGTQRVERLGVQEFLATKTHGIIDATVREAIIEYNQRGAKAQDVARILESVFDGNPDWDPVQVELNPVADKVFVDALDAFERIRLGSLRVARPNVDWSDHYDHLMSVAADSEARTVSVEVTAQRGGTLARTQGIIAFIRRLAGVVPSPIASAKIIGTRQGESDETTVSLAHHVEHQRVRVRLDTDGHVDDKDISKKLRAYADARWRRQRK